MKKFAILIPTFNEMNNIEILVKRICFVLKKYIFEIIVVDDNSQDGTIKILKKIKAKNKKFNYFIRKKLNRDLSKSIILGISKTKYENIIVMDGDLQHNPNYLPKICKIFSKRNLDFLVCVRNFEKRYGLSFIRFYSSKFLILMINFLLGKKISDPMSGFFIFKKDFFKSNRDHIYDNGFKILMSLVYSTKKKLNIYEQKIIFKRRFNNKSKMNFVVLFHIIISLIYYFIMRLKS
jgi:dolichol-phosphate mannosyltransferase